MADEAGPVTRTRGGGFALRVTPEERTLISGLLDEMRVLVTEPEASEAISRLFPVSYPDDPEHEAEYQRLMRDELVTSKLAGIETVTGVLRRAGRSVRLDEGELLALMQALNAVRLVLGTVLDVSDDDDDGTADDKDVSPEHHLYGYLSWLLDACVQATGESEPP